jgi:hypothetical protein
VPDVPAISSPRPDLLIGAKRPRGDRGTARVDDARGAVDQRAGVPSRIPVERYLRVASARGDDPEANISDGDDARIISIVTGNSVSRRGAGRSVEIWSLP